MSQYPHDEFDDVPPYQSGEAGKHRAPGASGGGAGRSGGLKWIVLMAVVVLVVGLFSWLFFGDDEDTDTTADGEDAVTEEQDEPAEGDEGAEGEDGAEGDGAEGDGEGGEGENGGEGTADIDMETPIQIYNYNGPEGTAANAQSQIEELGFNVTALNNWDSTWGEPSTPVVYYPEGEEDFAQQLASEMGADNVQQSDSFSTVAVVVGAEYGPGQ